MEDREIRNVLDVLDNAGIRYRMVSHDPVYTIEEMERLHLDADAEIAKNLFLRDARGKRHFLVVLCSCKTVDLKALRGQLGTSALCLGRSAETLSGVGKRGRDALGNPE